MKKLKGLTENKNRLQEVMDSKGVTYNQLARAMQEQGHTAVRRQHVREWALELVVHPTSEYAHAIACILGVKTEEIFYTQLRTPQICKK